MTNASNRGERLFEISELSKVSDDNNPPSIATPGRILVELIAINDPSDVYRYEAAVHDYDAGTSVFWITEGVGWNWWLGDVDFPEPGFWVVEGIKGYWIRGDGWTTDDDERWEHGTVRPATAEEIASQSLKEIEE